MADVALSVGRLLVAFVLVLLNGFFVAAEFAFVRVRSTAVEQLAAEGRAGSSTLQEVMGNLDDYLATTQLGITLASLGLGWAGEPAIAALLDPVLAPLLPESIVHLAAFALGFGFITFLHVVFGELAPKTIAIQEAERLSLFIAPPMKFFYYLFLPGIIVFNGTANAFTRLLGVPPASETEETLQEEELRMLLTRSGREGDVDPAEVEMIERVFELDDIAVSGVMVPRPDVVTVAADLSLPELRSVVLEVEHTRYPVLASDDPDHVVGYVDVKDVLRAGEDGDAAAGLTAGDLARDVVVVPETARVNDLLLQFRRDRLQMAAVIDEWGTFQGIATVEDVVEVVVGDLQDDFDVSTREPTIDSHDDGVHEIDGGVPIPRVNERLGSDFESDAFESIGGFLLDRLGRAPEVGDSVETDGYVLAVDAVDGNRIETVVVREPDADDAPSEK